MGLSATHMEDRGQRPSRTRGGPTLIGHRWPPSACRAPFFALALCASPLLNFGVANGVDHRDYAVILAVILAFFGGCLAFAALAHVVGSRFDTGLISAASLVMCIFLYGDFSRALRFIGSPQLILALWLAASMTLVVLVGRLWTTPGGPQPFSFCRSCCWSLPWSSRLAPLRHRAPTAGRC